MNRLYGATAATLVVLGVLATQGIFSTKPAPKQASALNELSPKQASQEVGQLGTEAKSAPIAPSPSAEPKHTILAEAEQLLKESYVGDIEVDGQINWDNAGQLIIDRQLRQLLDFYIGLIDSSRTGHHLTTLIQAHLIKNGVPQDRYNQVFTVLNQYLSYREKAALVPVVDYTSDALTETYNQLTDLRQQYLGVEIAEAFFGQDDARERYIIARQAILRDGTLTKEEKLLQLQTAASLLPYEIQQKRADATKLVNVRNQINTLNQNNQADIETVFQLRAETLGYEAAERLATLDNQRQDWHQRVNDYRLALDDLLQNTEQPKTEKKALIDQLQTQYFKGPELLRIKALDRAAGVF